MRSILALVVLSAIFALTVAPAPWVASTPSLGALAASDSLFVGPDTITMRSNVWYNPYVHSSGCGCPTGKSSNGAPVGNIHLSLVSTASVGAPESLWVQTSEGSWVAAVLTWTGPGAALAIDSWPPGNPVGLVRLRFRDGNGQPRFLACIPLVSYPV